MANPSCSEFWSDPIAQLLWFKTMNIEQRKSILFIILCAPVLFLIHSECQAQSGAALNPSKSVAEIVREANVVYDSSEFQTGHPYVPLLVSNGIVGGCFDHTGFQSTPNYDYPQGRTVFGYIRHYAMHESSRQIQFPLAVIQARFADGGTIDQIFIAKGYKQELDLFTGVLTTRYDLFGPTEIVALAHQTIPNLFVMHIDHQATSPGKKLVLAIECETSVCQNNQFLWPVPPVQLSFERKPGRVFIVSKTNLTTTRWVIDAGEPNHIAIDGSRVHITLNDQTSTIKFLMLRDDCPGLEVLDQSFDWLLAAHTHEWQTIWQRSWIDFPDDRAQKIWSRMKYYAVSHFPLIPEKAMLPTGLNCNIWGFTFPQDVYYVAENLPRLGHFERAEKALQYWLNILPEVKKYTRRIMHTEGAFYPWTPPFEQWDRYERDSVVAADSYELHNPAYVLAMVWHFYQYTGNREYLKRYFPVIQEVWRFYSSISERNAAGRFDVYHKNARGQDEASTTEGNLRNLLCASYSAEYSARIYLEAAKMVLNAEEKLLERAKSIMAAGYERNTLLTDRGYYATYEGDTRPPNSQKHPVQLNPIAFLPMPHLVFEGSPVAVAYQKRYELTFEATKPITLGWTFGEFFLASVRMREPNQALKDLSAIQMCRGADPRWIQFYESSFWTGWHFNKAYYFPMHALFMQGFTDMLVQDWRGYVDLFACVFDEWKDQSFSFAGIHTLDGISVDGNWDHGRIKIVLHPNGAKTVKLRISSDSGMFQAVGQKHGPASFRSGDIVSFVFSGSQAITLTN